MSIPVPLAPEAQVTARPSQTLTIAQLIIIGLGMVFSLLTAGLLFVMGLVGVFGQSASYSGATSVFAIAWIALLVALLCAPSVVLTILRLANRDVRVPRFPGFLFASTLMLLWPLVLVLGNLVVNKPNLAWLLFPPLEILAVGIPVWWLVEFARRKISAGSPQRIWGILDFSLLITTPVVVIVETVLLIGIGVFAALWISSQPELRNALERIANELSSGQMNPQDLMNLARPYLQNPLTILAILALVAGIIPMIEELFKPMAVWLLAGRRLTPAQGFAAGAVCGGAFALLESLLTVSGSAEQGWAFLVVARTGTALLHITTAALLGSALAAAWQSRAYLRLALTYLAACALHGLWNALSIFSSIGTLLENPPASLRFLASISPAARVVLVLLVLVLFVLLWNSNMRVRRESALQEHPAELQNRYAALQPNEAELTANTAAPLTYSIRPVESTDQPPSEPDQSI